MRSTSVWLVVIACGLLGIVGCGGALDPDASVPRDGGLDAPPTCALDEDCEDGLACNGESRCEEGSCVGGTPLACDDEIACSTDFCSEEVRGCVHRPVDADGDGHAASSCLDERGAPLGDDCDDDAVAIHPGALEQCDASAVDEDCDPETLGGRDGDADGYIDVACCNGAACGDDCNDAVRGASPVGAEVCNGIDDDCDAMIDERVSETVYRDVDGDGHGDPGTSITACPGRSGYVVLGDDCDDTNAARSPSLPEICDLVDNDCDGVSDPSDATVTSRWYVDGDGDGFGDGAIFVVTCAPPSGSYSLLPTDCDDTDPARHPAQPEFCNAIDDDCNGAADFEIAAGDLEDDDGDGRADTRCDPRPATPDCDDRDASASGDSPEVCDGRDNDCDARVDEGVLSSVLYRDSDGDGWGSDTGGVVVACGTSVGYVARHGDCDDGSPLRSPGALEGCNGVDEDCDGSVDEDPAATLCAPVGGRVYACRAGRCRDAPICPAGFADCDGLASNGCEAAVTSDAANCGVCGRRCPSEPGAISSCEASRCTRIACVAGALDCNGNLGADRDGCEHMASCGACGTPITSEVCGNGVDDDCDGVRDEGCCSAGVPCTTDCGSAGLLACDVGGGSRCAAPTESCNDIDDDCDGLRDEGCCTAGDSCRTACGSFGIRACGPMGTPGACTSPSETCNGRDDDCDSATDEGLGQIRCGRGACERTVPSCAAGVPGTCSPGLPGVEACNAIDDDCDAATDEGFGAPISCGVGACERTVPGCAVGGMMMTCTPGTPGTETCNGVDDDCDSRTDEGFGSLSCGVGACSRTVSACVMGVPGTCVPGMPSAETCNSADDDCNMLVDDGLGSTSCGVGACGRSVANCVGGAIQSCVPGMPIAELCNGGDDDCDTRTDESLASLSCGTGLCQRTVASCLGGAPQSCMPGMPLPELCNAMDDDCDMVIDDTCPLGVWTGAASTGTVFGLASFAQFDRDCAPGEAMFGVELHTGGLVDGLIPRCRPITMISTPMLPETAFDVVATGATTMLSSFGGTGGFVWPADECPMGTVPYGIRGGAGDDLDSLQLHCAPLALKRFGMMFEATLDVGMGTTTPLRGSGGGTPYDAVCPMGQIVVGLSGGTNPTFGEGGVVDSIALRCAPLSITVL